MRLSRRYSLTCLPLACIVTLAAAAQGAPPRTDATGPQPVYDPAQLPSYSGRVQQFTLTARGDIDGLILADGTEVKTPPHLSTSIAYSVRLGDPVSVHGLRAAALPLIQAVSITDQSTGRTVVDTGPPNPRAHRLPPARHLRHLPCPRERRGRCPDWSRLRAAFACLFMVRRGISTALSSRTAPCCACPLLPP
jgi:hypothetical protein